MLLPLSVTLKVSTMTGLLSHVAVANVGVVPLWRERPADVYTAYSSDWVQMRVDFWAEATEARARVDATFSLELGGMSGR